MLVGGDLGFLSSLVVAAFVAVFGPVLGLVVRRKWRRSVARREEIKRLLVLASEEAARVELQAAEEYGYGYGYSSYDTLKEDDVFVETPASSSPSTAPASSSPSTAPASSSPSTAPASSSSSTASTTSTSYSGSRQLQYQCAVCASPCSTRSRCSQCKAVRYCSGKCQILHWRQGHKDECRPVSNLDHRNDVEAKSHVKTYKQEPNGSHLENTEVEGSHSSESGDASPEEAALLRSKHTATSDGTHETVRQSLTETNSPNSNSTFVHNSPSCEHLDLTTSSGSSVDHSASDSNDSDASDSHRSAVIDTVKIQTNHSKVDRFKSSYTEQPQLVRTADKTSTSGKHNHIKPSIHGDTRSKYWTSTSPSIDDSSESSLTEPSTPSSGFWEGPVPYTRSTIGSPDSVADSPSRNACDIKISDSQSTSCRPPEIARPLISGVGEQGSNSTKNLENPNPIIVEVPKPVNGTESRFEVKDETESRRSSASRRVTSDWLDVYDSSDKCTLTSEEARYSASNASANLKNHDGLKVSSLPSSSPNKSYRGVEGSTSVPPMPKDRQKESSPAKDSDNISSSNGRHDIQNVKSAKIGSTQVAIACSAESSAPLPNARNGLKSSVLKVVDQFRGSKLTRNNSPGDECEVIGRNGNKGLFPYESFVKLHNWKNELRPFGLVNCGNSCYANAVLQCLAFTPPLTSYLLQGLHSKTCEKKGWCFTCEFESLVLKAKDGNSPLSPSSIISHLESIGSNLGNGREEDAHEFLRYVIDTMQSICLKEAGVTAPGSFEEETSLVGLTFGGYLRSKIECMRCGGKSERQERMMDLTVEIDGDIGTLEEALKQFTHTETLDGDNKYRCGRCKSYEKAKKKLKVLEAPNVLTIALKRFQSGKFGKLNKTIKFPEILNLAPYMSGTSDKSPVYQLYGVVVHLDIMNAAFSGHYVCYVRNFQNKWYKVDDSSVKPVELERVLSKGAYMLLYSRCSPRSPRIMRSLTIPRDPRRSKQLTCKSRSHTRSPWDSSHGDSTVQTCNECSYPNHTSVRLSRSIFEDDSSSEQSSSFFSELGSCSTDSTNRDSTSTDDLNIDIFGESGGCWNSPWRSSSDSDTSSSSSSPSPLYSRHSPLADLDRYASAHEETSCSCSGYPETAGDGHGFWTGLADCNGYAETSGRTPSLCPNPSKHCRKVVSSHNSSKTDSSRLGRVNPCDKSKSPVTCRDR